MIKNKKMKNNGKHGNKIKKKECKKLNNKLKK